MSSSPVVLRDDDPRAIDLLAEGWTVVGESWGARLRLDDDSDPAPFATAMSRVVAAGFVIEELSIDRAPELRALEFANHADYPRTPATMQPVLDLAAAQALWAEGARVFGAFAPADVVPGKALPGSAVRSSALAGNALLVGATVITPRGDRAETEFTSVRAGYRGRGIAVAVKAASVLALWRDGVRLFGTGGAAVNTPSLAMNRALGYAITERWLSLEPPAA